jgi:hypothetical protein
MQKPLNHDIPMVIEAPRPDGRRKVLWWINREWVHKGWLMPAIAGVNNNGNEPR